MNKERLDYIDVVKGISIISIVLLHFEEGLIPLCINTYIGEFMITAFYVAVGWIDATRDKDVSARELLSKRWVQLGKPYLYWSAIILVFDALLMAIGQGDIYTIAREAYKTVTLRGIGTLWFLPALFGGELLWNWTKRKNKLWIYIFLLIFVIVFQTAVSMYFDGKNDNLSRIINAPFQTLSSIGDAWMGIGFGFLMYKSWCGKFLREQSSMVILCTGLLLSALAFCSANFYPYPYGEKYMAPLIGPLGLFFVFKVVKIPVVSQYLTYWGKNSLGLMCTHYSLFMVVCTLIQNKIDGTTGQTLYGWPSVIHFVITMILSYFVVEAIMKYYPPLLGKKAQQDNYTQVEIKNK